MKRSSRPAQRAVLAIAALGALACREPAPPSARFTMLLRARSPAGEPVAEVRAWADGRALGTTSRAGELSTTLHGREGSAVELTVVCPAAFRADPPSRSLILRRVRGTGPQSVGEPLQLAVRCVPLETSAALIVLANGRAAGGLPIRVQGQVAGQTEADGSAHLLVNAPAAATLHVEIDTRARSNLQPRNPVHTFALQHEDGILLVEQTFTTPVRARATRRHIASAPVPRRPERIH